MRLRKLLRRKYHRAKASNQHIRDFLAELRRRKNGHTAISAEMVRSGALERAIAPPLKGRPRRKRRRPVRLSPVL